MSRRPPDQLPGGDRELPQASGRRYFADPACPTRATPVRAALRRATGLPSAMQGPNVHRAPHASGAQVRQAVRSPPVLAAVGVVGAGVPRGTQRCRQRGAGSAGQAEMGGGARSWLETRRDPPFELAGMLMLTQCPQVDGHGPALGAGGSGSPLSIAGSSGPAPRPARDQRATTPRGTLRFGKPSPRLRSTARYGAAVSAPIGCYCERETVLMACRCVIRLCAMPAAKT